ncbi:hypothetical protein AB0J86_14440 [Micromonospora sp. NPDC049559]|uniref:hypothetical protein n=1 Tax=Micromonospora sp. NPDC049559 TaxID=3155923 RepID=UPI003430A149
MRVELDDLWSLELPGEWSPPRRRSGSRGGPASRDDAPDGRLWTAPGRSLLVTAVRDAWRCASELEILADLDGRLPPDPTGRIGEGGGNGVGFRAAWWYRHPPGGQPRYALHGYSFVAGEYLETLFRGADGDDSAWAFDAWRSVRHGRS